MLTEFDLCAINYCPAAARIEIEVEPEFRERFQGKGEEHAIFVDPVIVTNDRAERSDPTGEIAIDGITLLFKQPGRAPRIAPTLLLPSCR